MTKAVVKVSREDSLILEKAKEAFQKMQKTWWEFAKAIYEIRETETYKSAGYETFKEFCEEEYATTNFKSIMKFITVVEMMGKSIEAKIEKDKSYSLPAYEACYTLATMKEGAVSKEDMSRLKRDVLERKLSYHKLRDRVKELLETKRKETKEFIKKSEDEISLLEKQLEKEIDASDVDAEVEIDDSVEDAETVEDFDAIDMSGELVDSDFESVFEGQLSTATRLAAELSDAVDLIEESLTSAKFNKKIEKFAIKIDKTYSKLDSLLDTIQEMQK